MVPPAVLNKDLVWGMNHIVSHGSSLPVRAEGSRRCTSRVGPARLKEHVRKAWNWVTSIWVLVLRPFYSVTLGKKSPCGQPSAQGWLFLSSSLLLFSVTYHLPWVSPHMIRQTSGPGPLLLFTEITPFPPLIFCSHVSFSEMPSWPLFKIANDSLPARNVSPSLPVSFFKNPNTVWLLIYVTYLSCLYSVCSNSIRAPEGQDFCPFVFKLWYPWYHQQHLS